MIGSYLPSLCIGIELLRSNNYPLAKQFIVKSLEICPYDPLIYNELGVVFFKNKEYQNAIEQFNTALGLIDEQSNQLVWEPIFFNIGHCYRKLREYDEALKYYHKALTLSPKQSSSLSAIAFTYHLKGDISEAIEYYHISLSYYPEDTFVNGMLKEALEEYFPSDLQ